MLLDFKNETRTPTKPGSPDELTGPPGGEFGDNSPLKDNLLAVMTVLGATYGWLLALVTGVIALIVILFR